jgi:hypothetical protein
MRNTPSAATVNGMLTIRWPLDRISSLNADHEEFKIATMV